MPTKPVITVKSGIKLIEPLEIIFKTVGDLVLTKTTLIFAKEVMIQKNYTYKEQLIKQLFDIKFTDLTSD